MGEGNTAPRRTRPGMLHTTPTTLRNTTRSLRVRAHPPQHASQAHHGRNIGECLTTLPLASPSMASQRTVNDHAAQPDNHTRIFPALGCYIAGYIRGGGTGHARDWHFTHGSGTSRIPDHKKGRPYLADSNIQLCATGPHARRLTECARVTTQNHAHTSGRERGLPTGDDRAPHRATRPQS